MYPITLFVQFFPLVQVRVSHSAGSVVSPSRVVGSPAAGPPGDGNTASDVLTGDFQRQSTGGSFELSNYRSGSKIITQLLLITVNIFLEIVILFSIQICIFF